MLRVETSSTGGNSCLILKPGQKSMAGVLIGPEREPTTVVFEMLKLPSKYLYL